MQKERFLMGVGGSEYRESSLKGRESLFFYEYNKLSLVDDGRTVIEGRG